MAGQQAAKPQSDVVELLTGSVSTLAVPEEQRALAELLLLRCGDNRLIGSQMLDQARLCGQAVKAAFEELSKEADSKE